MGATDAAPAGRRWKGSGTVHYTSVFALRKIAAKGSALPLTRLQHHIFAFKTEEDDVFGFAKIIFFALDAKRKRKRRAAARQPLKQEV